MLHAIRERATGWVAYLIVLLISIPFALWGISEYLGFGGGLEAAEVNGEAIAIEEFNQTYQQQRQDSPADLEQDEQMRADILDGMIKRRLLLQYLDRQNLNVTDAKVMQSIGEMEIFHGVEGFDPQRYQNILRSNQFTRAEFENDQRQQLRIEIMQALMEASAFVTREESLAYRALREQTRDARYFSLNQADFRDAESVSEEDVEAEYQLTLDQHTTPARVKVSYVMLRMESLQAEADPSEEDLAAYHRSHALDFMTDELRRVRQIFLKSEDGVEAVAEDLRQQLREGGDFAALAQQHSQDDLSREMGGEIGWVAQEDLPEELGAVVFSLMKDVVSEPVSTSLGVYLLEVQGIEEARFRPLEEVREQVLERARQENLEQRYAEVAEELSIWTYENPESLDPAVEHLGLSMETTALLPLAELPEPLNTPEAQAVLQQNEVLQEGLNSDRIDMDARTAIVVRVDEYEASQTRPLEEVAEAIREDLIQRDAQEKMLERAAEITEQLREDPDFEAIAAQQEASVETRTGILRTDGETPAEVLERLFALGRPVEETPVFGMAILPDAVAVIALDAVHEAELDAPDEGDQDLLRWYTQTAEVDAFWAALEAQAEIVRYPERLE